MLGGGGGCAKICFCTVHIKNAGEVGVIPKYFIDVKKCWGGGGLCQNILWT